MLRILPCESMHCFSDFILMIILPHNTYRKVTALAIGLPLKPFTLNLAVGSAAQSPPMTAMPPPPAMTYTTRSVPSSFFAMISIVLLVNFPINPHPKQMVCLSPFMKMGLLIFWTSMWTLVPSDLSQKAAWVWTKAAFR